MRNRTILVFENSEFESEDRPRHLTLQNVQLHICPTVCIGCLNLSWARHYAFCYCWKAEAVVLRRTQEMEKSLSLGFYCSNYLHCCFLASRSIIHQKIAVTYFWSSYLLWLGILFEIKRRLFARCSFTRPRRGWFCNEIVERSDSRKSIDRELRQICLPCPQKAALAECNSLEEIEKHWTIFTLRCRLVILMM